VIDEHEEWCGVFTGEPCTCGADDLYSEDPVEPNNTEDALE
jgi:hypothetical protein